MFSSSFRIELSEIHNTLSGKYGSGDWYWTLNIGLKNHRNSTGSNRTNCSPETIINKKPLQAYLNLVTIDKLLIQMILRVQL